jgi:UDP-N-acetylmuramate dehydrogenase
VELESVFHSLHAVEIGTGQVLTFSKEDCQFGYRESIFKKALRDQYVIVSVTLQLTRQHQIDVSYGAIQQMLNEWSIDQPTIQDVSKAVIHIRQSKLPDPEMIGNAGSFFKNPIITSAEFERLKKDHPETPGYPGGVNVKVPAGWLIEQAGWKGRKVGQVGCYEKQALVLVNFGGAKGEEVWSLAQEIIESVDSKFGIRLQPEVNLWR